LVEGRNRLGERSAPGSRVEGSAWFTDPDGNIFSVFAPA
jgi:hypothetical protein